MADQLSFMTHIREEEKWLLNYYALYQPNKVVVHPAAVAVLSLMSFLHHC